MNKILFMVAALGLLFVAVPAFAEETDKVQELQRVIDAQQRQLEIQMQMLIQLQSEVERISKSADKERAAPGEGDALEQPPSASTPAGVSPQSAPASVADHSPRQLLSRTKLRRAPLNRLNPVAQRSQE